MARRSVVVEDPPQEAPRRAVVVRPGPPQRDRRTWFDLGAGVVGAVLLILTISLFALLPHDEPPLPQFEVTFRPTLVEDGAVQDHAFAVGGSYDFALPYDGENLYEVDVAFEWTDDVASSLPDRFQVSLLDPEGTVVAGPTEFLNPQPGSDGNPVAPTYTAVPTRQALRFEVASRPSTEVVTALDAGETPEEVQHRVEAENARGGAGTWTLHVTLVEAGGCPDPTSIDINRVATCQAATAGQGDTGNPFQVTLVTFTRYDPQVEAL